VNQKKNDVLNGTEMREMEQLMLCKNPNKSRKKHVTEETEA